MSWRKKVDADQPPRKLLAWSAVIGLVFGLIGFGEIAEDWLRVGRNSLHAHQASGDIVLVKIDDESLQQVGRWPWPRRYHAQLTDALVAAGVDRIFFDLMLENATSAEEDAQLAEALRRSGRATIGVRARSGFKSGDESRSQLLPAFRSNSETASLSVGYNYQNAVWRLPYQASVGASNVPSFAAKLARRGGPPDAQFTVDYSIDPTTVPTLSAADVLNGTYPRGILTGKDVIVGTSSEAIGDQYFLPGWGKMAGAYVHVLGAETLKSGTPMSLGWIPAFLVATALSIAAALRKRPIEQGALLGFAAATLLVAPIFLEMRLLFLDVTPGLFVLASVATGLSWRRFRSRGFVNSLSGLPNLSALRSDRGGRDKTLIAARILNYDEIVASLPAEAERQLVEQVVSRLRLGAPNRTLYQGDAGIFAWFEDAQLPFGNHIDALYALFRTPARVGKVSVDVSVAFGVEIGSGRSLSNRLASALVAAEEAAHAGLKWKYHDPETLQDASWKLSMLSQLDEAVDQGEVWVAYQPKLDLKTRTIVGAEALARWTHPEKGPIAASEFIAAAEQHDRIGKLTDFVLDRALAAAATVNRRHHGFGMAVNLSARLLSDQRFALRLRAMLARHGVAPESLTLELTETAALAGSGSAIEVLAALRDLGVEIAIDDYGTGLSTLEYLKKIPANEIKIDQSFVKGMLDNRSDRLMVQSTIGLAHSLGRKVVAEGVERREVLDTLVEMECDMAQGFIIGRPMSVESLLKRIGSRKSQAA